MQIKKTEGFLPVKKSTVRPVGVSGAGRSHAQGGYYDRFTVSSTAAERGSFREMAANLSYQVRTCNTTGKIQELRRQVQSGEYRPDAQEIARRMLLMGEVQE